MEWLFPPPTSPLPKGSPHKDYPNSNRLIKAAGRYTLAAGTQPFFTQDPELMPKGRVQLWWSPILIATFKNTVACSSACLVLRKH
jgi:hypothetical protein